MEAAVFCSLTLSLSDCLLHVFSPSGRVSELHQSGAQPARWLVCVWNQRLQPSLCQLHRQYPDPLSAGRSPCSCRWSYLHVLLLLQRDTLEMVGEPVSGMARCPYDPRHANVALFAGRVDIWTPKAVRSSRGNIVVLVFTFTNDLWSHLLLHCLFGFNLPDLVLSLHLSPPPPPPFLPLLHLSLSFRLSCSQMEVFSPAR